MNKICIIILIVKTGHLLCSCLVNERPLSAGLVKRVSLDQLRDG